MEIENDDAVNFENRIQHSRIRYLFLPCAIQMIMTSIWSMKGQAIVAVVSCEYGPHREMWGGAFGEKAHMEPIGRLGCILTVSTLFTSMDVHRVVIPASTYLGLAVLAPPFIIYIIVCR